MTRTNAYSLLTILIRTAALWMVLAWARLIPLALDMRMPGHEDASVLPMVLGLCAVPLVAGIMWIFADVIARLALARPQQIVFDSDVPAAEWQGVAFSVVGLWYACDGLVHLARLFSQHLYAVYVLHNSAALVQSVVGSTIPGAIVQTLLGIALVFRARGLVAWVRRLREYGAPSAIAHASDDADGA